MDSTRDRLLAKTVQHLATIYTIFVFVHNIAEQIVVFCDKFEVGEVQRCVIYLIHIFIILFPISVLQQCDER